MQNSASARLSRNISPEEYDLVILGSGAGGLPYAALRDAVLAHPTLVEGISPLFASTPSMPK